MAFDNHCKSIGYENAVPLITDWLSDANPNVRRAASEGLRVWTSRPYFKDHPSVAIRLLSDRKTDSSEYVRKSIGNALKDISKKHPELVFDEIHKWDVSSKEIKQVYNSFAKYATLQKLISMPEMSGIICPYTYYLPDEHLDYSDPELLLWADNQALLMPFTRLHSRYQPINMADRLGLQGDDRITFLNFGYMYQLDPTQFEEFRARTLPRVDSVLQTKPFDVETALQWAGPITDSLLPTPGPNRDYMFASGFRLLWRFSEMPLSDQTLDFIRNELADSPLLRDSLLECNTRYRRLAEQNASLLIPTWTVGDTIVQADSIVRSLLSHSTDRPTCLLIPQPLSTVEQISALQKALETEPIDIIYIFQEGFPYKWRNTTARYGLTGPNVRHCLLDQQQFGTLTQTYRVRPDQPLFLFDRDDHRITAPVPSLSNLENVLTFIRDHTKP